MAEAIGDTVGLDLANRGPCCLALGSSTYPMRQLTAPLQIEKVKKVPSFISRDHDKLATTVQRNTRVLRDMGSRRSFSPAFFQAHELGCRSLGLWANKNKRHGVSKRILALKAH